MIIALVGSPVIGPLETRDATLDSSMRKSRFSETQIIPALLRQDSGEKARDICREVGIIEPTFYNWKSKYSGMSASDLRLKGLEAENDRPKRVYADLAIVHEALNETVAKKL